MLIGGSDATLDLADLQRHTHYGGVYQVGDDGALHPTILAFWSVMHEFDFAQQSAVIKFVTSTPRAPLQGFKALLPRFTIRDSGLDQARLPSASTCVNQLKLPVYRSREVLREKLLVAVLSGTGFHLS